MPKYAPKSELVDAFEIPSPGTPKWGEFLAWALENDLSIRREEITDETVEEESDEDVEIRQPLAEPVIHYTIVYPTTELTPGCFVVLGKYGHTSVVSAEEFAKEYGVIG